MTAPTLPDDVREKVRVGVAPLLWPERTAYAWLIKHGSPSVDAIINAILLALSEAGFVVVRRDGLEQVAAWFDDYERQHAAKETIEGYLKAKINGERAAYVRSLAASEKP